MTFKVRVHAVNHYLRLNRIGEQNLLPLNVSLACGLFQAENNQGPKDSERNFDLPLNCLKNIDKGPITAIDLSPEISALNKGER